MNTMLSIYREEGREIVWSQLDARLCVSCLIPHHVNFPQPQVYAIQQKEKRKKKKKEEKKLASLL